MAFLAFYLLVMSALALQQNAADSNFNTYYTPRWGQNHISINPQGTEAQLLIDQSSGAGFKSKADYGSGLFHIKIKLPHQKTGGIVTTFYLTSVQDNQGGNHYELDFEFVGTSGRLSTNVFDNDSGHREQVFNVWFDPSQDFHSYYIFWSPYQIVFFIDNIPIRVFKNNSAQGIPYPSKPMHIEASIWDAPNWAGDTNWTVGPFVARYTDFGFSGCSIPLGGDALHCASEAFPWNQRKYWKLSRMQEQQLKEYRAKYMVFDYCNTSPDKKLECSLNN